MIRSANTDDCSDLAAIYNHYILNSCATFETKTVDGDEMAQRLADVQAAQLPWLLAESSGEIAGYAYAAPWSAREAYRLSVESTIYLRDDQTGKGIGLPLYTALVDAVRKRSMRTMIGGIALPNEPSIYLHEQLGFRKTGEFKQVGFKQDRWVDVGYWQLLL